MSSLSAAGSRLLKSLESAQPKTLKDLVTSAGKRPLQAILDVADDAGPDQLEGSEGARCRAIVLLLARHAKDLRAGEAMRRWVLSGHEDAIEALTKHAFEIARSTARRYFKGGDFEYVREVVLEARASLLKILGTKFDPKLSPTYVRLLYTLIRNIVVSTVRRSYSGGLLRTESQLRRACEDVAYLIDEILREEGLDQIQLAMQALSADEHQVVVMKFEGATYAQIGNAIGKEVSECQKLWRHAMGLLRHFLHTEGGER